MKNLCAQPFYIRRPKEKINLRFRAGKGTIITHRPAWAWNCKDKNMFKSVTSGIIPAIILLSSFAANSYADTKASEKKQTIRIASFNIENGTAVKHDFSVIAKDILENKIDIVGIQEVDKMATRSKKQDTIKLIAEATGYPYYYYTPCIDLQGGKYGTAILSKYPICDTGSTYLESDGHEQRMLGHVWVDVNGVCFDFFNTHLSYEEDATRTKQFGTIAEQTARTRNFIVTGDFNTANFKEFTVIKGTKLVNNETNLIQSHPEAGPIDNIVYSTNFFTFKGSKRVDSASHSDHYMIWADFEIPAKKAKK